MEVLMRERELLQKAHSNICLLPALGESEPPMQQAPCKYATATANAELCWRRQGGNFSPWGLYTKWRFGGKANTFKWCPQGKTWFWPKEAGSGTAIYKNQRQPKHSSGLSSASSWGTQRKFDVYWKPGYYRGCSLARIAWKPVLKLNAKMLWQFSHWLAILLSQCMCLLLCCLFLTGCNYLSCFWLRFL